MVNLMLQSRFGPTDFRSATGVSRETLEKLQLYCSLLLTWQRHSNLIGESTIDDIWHRHFLDSAQLMKLCKPGSSRLVDFGSGASVGRLPASSGSVRLPASLGSTRLPGSWKLALAGAGWRWLAPGSSRMQQKSLWDR